MMKITFVTQLLKNVHTNIGRAHFYFRIDSTFALVFNKIFWCNLFMSPYKR